MRTRHSLIHIAAAAALLVSLCVSVTAQDADPPQVDEAAEAEEEAVPADEAAEAKEEAAPVDEAATVSFRFIPLEYVPNPRSAASVKPKESRSSRARLCRSSLPIPYRAPQKQRFLNPVSSG